MTPRPRSGLLGSFGLAALLALACGGAARAGDAPLDDARVGEWASYRVGEEVTVDHVVTGVTPACVTIRTVTRKEGAIISSVELPLLRGEGGPESGSKPRPGVGALPLGDPSDQEKPAAQTIELLGQSFRCAVHRQGASATWISPAVPVFGIVKVMEGKKETLCLAAFGDASTTPAILPEAAARGELDAFRAFREALGGLARWQDAEALLAGTLDDRALDAEGVLGRLAAEVVPVCARLLEEMRAHEQPKTPEVRRLHRLHGVAARALCDAARLFERALKEESDADRQKGERALAIAHGALAAIPVEEAALEELLPPPGE